MKNKFKVSRRFILDAHSAACSDWKEKLEKEFPDAFAKERLEVGKWYKHPRTGLMCATEIDDNGVLYGYGFDDKEDFHIEQNKSSGKCLCNEVASGFLRPATNKEVEQALIKEAIKRGFKEDRLGMTRDFSVYEDNGNRVLNVFLDGKWAAIIEEPKEIVIDGITYIPKQ